MSAARPRSGTKGSRRRRAGYTLIEVVMAIGVLTAGAVGIMALQQAATRGNMESRQMTTATQLAQRWIERLRRDGLGWRTGTTVVPVPVTVLSSTTYLQQVPASGAAAPFFVPVPPVASGESANFDYYGRDTTVAADMHYCTNVRLEWLYPGRAMRADVRVWWARRAGGTSDDDMADLAGCAPDIDPDTLTTDWRVRSAYASTVLRYVAQ